MKQQSTHRVLSARRTSVQADASDVVPRVFCSDRFVPEDSIGKAGVSQILPSYIVKSLGTIRCSHPFDLDHDEANFSLGHHRRVSKKRFRYERALGPGVDVFDHRILLSGIEIGWSYDDTPDVSLAVATGRGKDLRRSPANF